MRHTLEFNNLYCTHGVMKYSITGVCSVVTEGEQIHLEGVNITYAKVEMGYTDLTSDFGGYFLNDNQIKNLESRLQDYPQFIWFIKEKLQTT